jgi:transcriptional regulator GlxA family with amidase domain
MSTFRIGIPVYPFVDLLDVAAPREVFYWMEEIAAPARAFRTVVLAETREPVPTRAGLPIVPDLSFADFDAAGGRLDLIWVPGGRDSALEPLMGDTPFRARIQKLAAGASWITSVCTGAVLLADAGLLTGFRATTHWSTLECLKAYGVRVAKGHPRFVVDRRRGEAVRVTGGGVSSGLDEALALVELLCDRATAEQVQQYIQYFPDPPVHAAIPATPPCDLPVPPRRGR